jgi:hypothetical protein
MTNLFIYNRFGENEIVDVELVGGNDIKENEYDILDFESDVIKEFALYDDVLRIKVEDDFDEDEVLAEVDRLDEEYFG